jgi:hypothetical protein
LCHGSKCGKRSVRVIQEHSLEADVADVYGGERESDRIVRGLDERLTFAEDSELRRLHYMSTVGFLSERSRERFIELRLRDRREKIREPREFGTDERPAAQPSRIRKLLRMGR